VYEKYRKQYYNWEEGAFTAFSTFVLKMNILISFTLQTLNYSKKIKRKKLFGKRFYKTYQNHTNLESCVLVVRVSA
jgi:hypothetical protein